MFRNRMLGLTAIVLAAFASTDASAMYVVNAAGGLNVRTGPGTNYPVIRTLANGTSVIVVESSGDWRKISSPVAGWVNGWYLAAASLTNLNMVHAYQETNYWCGPATAWMVIRHVRGSAPSQGTLAGYMGTTTSGSSSASIMYAVRNWTGEPYTVLSGFNRDRVVSNIRQNRPVPINFNCRYLAYAGYRTWYHHTPIKGYTDGGYYIHDSNFGPDRWASSTETWNAVVYCYNLFLVRY